MSKHKDHKYKACKVRASFWHHGRLIANDSFFDRIEDAVEFATVHTKNNSSQDCKVYDVDGSLTVHHRKIDSGESYA
jgi:hypothetical protein